MKSIEQHRRELAWRGTEPVLDALPDLAGRAVLDLGCGPGAVAEWLARHGARVTGVDGSAELVAAMRARGTDAHARDLRDPRALDDLPHPGESGGAGGTGGIGAIDGIWCSFTAAYLPDLAGALAAWREHLRPGGWIALIEIDDLFGHAPLPPRVRDLLETYADAALAAGRYDFRRGRRMRGALERAGFEVQRELDLEDRELAFTGAAHPDVLASWRARLDHMHLLRDHCGPAFAEVRDALLACLASAEHRSLARVVACVAIRPERR